MIGDFSLDTPISKKGYFIAQRPKPLRISESAPWAGFACVSALVLALGISFTAPAAFGASLGEAESSYRAGRYSAARAGFEALAEAGNERALDRLGIMAAKGQGGTRSDSDAAHYILKSAEAGYGKAQFEIGWMYFNGVGVSRDTANAISWYQKAVDNNISQAAYNLGGIYLRGEFIEKSASRARLLMEKASSRGFTPAQNDLGVMYWNGVGGVQDKKLGFMWVSLAAGRKFPSGIRNRVLFKASLSPSDVKRAVSMARDCVSNEYKSCNQLSSR